MPYASSGGAVPQLMWSRELLRPRCVSYSARIDRLATCNTRHGNTANRRSSGTQAQCRCFPSCRSIEPNADACIPFLPGTCLVVVQTVETLDQPWRVLFFTVTRIPLLFFACSPLSASSAAWSAVFLVGSVRFHFQLSTLEQDLPSIQEHLLLSNKGGK